MDGAQGWQRPFVGVGGGVISYLRWVGGVSLLLLRALRVAPTRPLGTYDIAYQTVQHGIRSLPMATLMAVFLGMILSWQFGEALMDFGAKMALGKVASLALVREIVPTVLAITVGCKMAAGMTAELGSMKVTEQIDAVAALGADPVKKLVWPRLAAASLSMPLLVAWGNLVALGGGMLIAEFVLAVPADYFYSTYIDELVPRDYMTSLIKGGVFGCIVGIIGCYQGFATRFGTEAVGIATTETVVSTSVSIILADFVLTIVLIPIQGT